MAELKPFEVIMRYTPMGGENAKADIQLMLERVEQLVRCKNCKHRIVNEHYGEKGYMKLKAMCELDTGDPFERGRCAEVDEWFCADGERREDGIPKSD